MVVDDDNRIRELVKQYLIDYGYLVTTARDAFDAKNKINITPINNIGISIPRTYKPRIFLKQKITFNQFLGVVLIMGGIYLIR